MENTIWCFIICFGSATTAPAERPIDSYCSSYQQVVLSHAELELILRLPRPLRDKIQGNELEYLCRCKGWKDEACRTKGKI